MVWRGAPHKMFSHWALHSSWHDESNSEIAVDQQRLQGMLLIFIFCYSLSHTARLHNNPEIEKSQEFWHHKGDRKRGQKQAQLAATAHKSSQLAPSEPSLWRQYFIFMLSYKRKKTQVFFSHEQAFRSHIHMHSMSVHEIVLFYVIIWSLELTDSRCSGWLLRANVLIMFCFYYYICVGRWKPFYIFVGVIFPSLYLL